MKRHLLVSLFLPSLAFACGPYFPNAFLVWGQESLLQQLPEPDFYHTLQASNPPRATDNAYETSWARTLKGDLDDLRAALATGNLDTANQLEVIVGYQALRKALKTHSDGSRHDSVFGQRRPGHGVPFDLAPHQETVNRLPREFRHYLLGAVAYRAADYETAIEHWRDLLAMPRPQREWRSVWAAFMIGKAFLVGDQVAEAEEHFLLTRRLARDGFRDTIGLATSSIGWEAMVAARRDDLARALQLSYKMFCSQDRGAHANGYSNLRVLCRRLFENTPLDTSLAADPMFRRIITAYVISHPNLDSAPWYEAVRKFPPPQDGADRLAWIAYANGNIAQAQQWLELAHPDTAFSVWVAAKLSQRAGDSEASVRQLRQLTALLPRTKEPNYLGYDNGRQRFTREDAFAELGVIYTGQEQFAEAITAFLNGGYWLDAAYLAERVLTLDELRDYLDTFPVDEAATDQFPWANERPLRERLAWLFARRLTRERPAADATEFFPAAFQKPYQRWRKYQTVGTDERLPKHARAQNWYAAGLMTDEIGMQLIGTELNPDWFAFSGSFAMGPAAEHRYTKPTVDHSQFSPAERLITAGNLERQRVGQHPTPSDKRFHYRYRAAEMMWTAAELMPDNHQLTALALYEGGLFIAAEDPQAADRFYKALVNRCGRLPIGAAADRKRWFPPSFLQSAVE